ncbi:MAG TPA: universal stress protein [Saprospiraceae bacterium]|nr:universal stress protein [Saprospiraceae bacterium]HPI08621.1 universal stress protein [Saprospiraceae bacterium]
MKKILVPVDFSPNSMNALHVAAEIAHKSGAVLEMLHVNIAAIYSTPLSEYVVVSKFEGDDQQYDDTAVSKLEKLKMELLADPAYANLNIQIRVEEGYLHSAVRNVAQDDAVDLVVMGTKGTSGMNEFLVGSNTEKVIRTSPCPVLAVPEGTQTFAPKIALLPSTLKDDQLNVFKYVAGWEKLFKFHTRVLYLNNVRNLPTDGSAEAQKNRLAEASGLKHTDVILTHETFFEDNAILSTADQFKADMIVMGTHQRHGLSHILFGSITEDTVNHSHIPVLAVPIGWSGK